MEKIKFSLQLPRKHKVIFIEEQSENKILSYEQTLKAIYQMLKDGFEIMAD